MPPEQGDEARLADMLEACRSVVEFVRGKRFYDYEKDKLLRSGVERQIQIIGEAARNVSKTFQVQHPQIQWTAIIATRHILVHDYADVKLEKVWRAATIHVPE